MISSTLHIAIIMDGNGRWATRRGLPRSAGHRAGVRAVRRVIEAAPGLGVSTLTLYAFSSDNWRRPADEVGILFGLLAAFLENEIDDVRRNGIRLSFLGRRDRLPTALAGLTGRAERETAAGTRLWVRIALDYSSRDAILAAAAGTPHPVDRPAFARRLGGAPDVDLLIRTGGEQRLSDFLLWESAYAELLFVETMWPDFDGAGLRRAIEWFHRRDRRFGGLPKAG